MVEDLILRDNFAGGAELPPPEEEDESPVLEMLSLIDTPPEEAFDKYTRLVKRLTGAPVAVVSFIDEANGRQYFKSVTGLRGAWAEARETPLTHSFCQHVRRLNRPLVISDAPKDALVCNNLAIPDLGVRAYLGVPIHGPHGRPLGALAAIEGAPRAWSDADLAGMTDLGACVTDQIRLREALCWSCGA